MTAQPVVDEPGPDDPAQILRVLPREYHDRFRAEYAEAVEAARRPEEFAALASLLRLWRLERLRTPILDSLIVSLQRATATRVATYRWNSC